MPRYRSMPNITQPPQHWSNVPFASQSSGSIVRPSTSPMVGLLPPRGDQVGTLLDTTTSQLLKKGLDKPRSTPFAAKRPSTSDRGSNLPPKGPLQPLPVGDNIMVIEGTQTGEERPTEVLYSCIALQYEQVTAMRELHTRSHVKEVTRNMRRADQRRERLEADAKKLSGLLSMATKEAAVNKIAYDKKLCEVNRRFQNLLQGALIREQELQSMHRSDLEELEQAEWRAMMQEGRYRVLASETNRQRELIIELKNDLRHHTNERGLVDTKYEAARRELSELNSILKLRELTSSETSTNLDSLKDQQKSRERVIFQMKAALAEETAANEKSRQEVRELRDSLIHKEAAMLDLKTRSEQLIQYVTKICQPHFAVVKDETLTPVNVSGFQVTEGHVLVPLVLLLEGYALLPPQLRTAIDIKSSKLHKSIDYKLRATEINSAEPSYKNRLYSMMDDKAQRDKEPWYH